MAETRTRDRDQEPPLEHPKTPRQALLRALAEAAMSVTHHDAGDHEPGFIHEVRSMERKFAGLLRGKLKSRWAGRAALTQPETPDHG